MKHLRTFLAISVFSAGAYWAVVNLDLLSDWFSPAPQASVPVEVPVPVVVLQEEAPDTKAQDKAAEPEAIKAGEVHQTVVPPKPVSPTPTKFPVVASATPKPAPISAPDPTPVAAKEALPVPPSLDVVPPQQAQAPVADTPSEPVKPSVAVIAAPAPAQPSAPAVSQVAPVVAATASVPMASSAPAPAPKQAASAPAVSAPKESAVKPKPVPEKTKEIQLTIKDIQFTGVTAFPTSELSQVVSEFVGKELTVEEAFAIPAKVTKHYKRHNRMAIATLVGAISPDGVLTVGVVEMQMSQAQADKALALLPPEGAAPTPTSSAPAPAPAPVPTAALPSKSDEQSETDYILKNYAKKTRQYEIIVDNFGHESTGSTRMGAALAFDGDRFSLLGLKSGGSDYVRMAVRWATGIDGLKLGANLSKLNYEVTQHLETAIYQSGDAAKKGVDLIYQLVNEPGHMSSLGLQRVAKSINSVGVNLTDSSSMTSNVSTLEWRGVLREMMPGGAVLSYGASYSRGEVDISGSSTMSGLDVPEGLFAKLRFDGTLLQPLGGLSSVFGRLSIQSSDKNLDPSERFYLGGPTGVRAYGVGEGIGSKGELLTLEFRQRLAAGTTLAEFYDWGSVRQLDSDSSKTVLKGYGLSLSQDMGAGTTLKGTWARSSGQPDPALPLNSNDQYDRNRFWLSLESRF